MDNIFQGNKLIEGTIAKALELKYSDDPFKNVGFTESIYFTSFFYLTQRFGKHIIFDDYKDAGIWDFKVKEFHIQIYLNSCWVTFMVFGNIGNHEIHSPLWVKTRRKIRENSDIYLDLYSEKFSDKQKRIMENLFTNFIKENNIATSISQEKFDEEYSHKWFDYLDDYNDKILGIDKKSFREKYGEIYQNHYTRFALKTLTQFLHNMLTPIWIRDVPYNIKGLITDKQAYFYEKYSNNIKIEFNEQK